MTEVVVTTGDIRRATNKTTPTFLQAGCPSCRPAECYSPVPYKWKMCRIMIIITEDILSLLATENLCIAVYCHLLTMAVPVTL